MPNPLTGDFDAVVQVSDATVDRLLASMHQNDGNDAGLPTLPHRMVARIGDQPQQTGTSSEFPTRTINIRGTAYVQIGAPTVSLVSQSSRDADVSCWIRARYHRDPGTIPLPEFINGKVVARFHVEPETTGGVSGLRASASNDDAHIAFADSGLAGDDLKWVLYVIRSFLRSRVDAFLQLPADLPSGASDLRGIRDSQGRQALALPVTLKGAAPTTGSVGRVFLDGSHFAISVGRDYILGLIQPQLDALKASHPGFSIHVKYWGTANYTVTITKAEASWFGDGRIGISVAGNAKTSAWWAPNVSFGVSQDLKIVVHFLAFNGGPMASVVPVGQPAVSVSAGGPFGGIAKSWARNAVLTSFVQARENALAQARPLVGQALAKTQLLRELLLKIDEAAQLTWTNEAASADGMTLRGNIALSPRKAPRVGFTELGDGSGYSAFESWVPGGRVTEYHWSWWRGGEPSLPLTGGPPLHFKTLADRYVLQQVSTPPGAQPAAGSSASANPSGAALSFSPSAIGAYEAAAGIWAPVFGQTCLSIAGECVDPQTGEVQWVGGDAQSGGCTPTGHVPPPPVERPPEGLPTPYGFRQNVLVYAYAPVAQDAGGALATLRESLRQTTSEAGLVLMLMSSIGSEPTRDMVTRAGELQRDLPQTAIVLADRDRPWTRALDLPADKSRTALRLLDPGGRLVWRHDGPVDASVVMAALGAHLVASPPPRARLLRTAMYTGERARDFSFEIAGRAMALRRFRGRRVALVFVRDGKPASEALLERLSGLAGDGASGGAGRLLAIFLREGQTSVSGPAPTVPGVDALTVADPNGAIARSYGVRVQPTVVLVDRDGRISAVQAGPGHGRTGPFAEGGSQALTNSTASPGALDHRQ